MRPIVRDLHLTPLVFDIAQLRCTRDGARKLFERLDLIHDALAPKGKRDGTPDAE